MKRSRTGVLVLSAALTAVLFMRVPAFADAEQWTLNICAEVPGYSESVDVPFNKGDTLMSVLKKGDQSLTTDFIWSGGYVSAIKYDGTKWQYGSGGTGLDGIMVTIDGILTAKGVSDTYPWDGDNVCVYYEEDYTSLDYSTSVTRSKKELRDISSAGDGDHFAAYPNHYTQKHHAGAEWISIEGSLRCLDKGAYLTGWQTVWSEEDQKCYDYYFKPNGDITMGWCWITPHYADGNYKYCFKFDEKGRLQRGVTEDGFTTGPDGAWTVDGKVQYIY